MKVSNERLRIVGKMIGVYREERRANSQNCWTQKRFCKDICSPNTLKNIESGELARSIEVYDELLAKFNLKLGEFPAIDEAIYKLTKDLYKALDFYAIDDIVLICRKVLRILDKVSSYIYYSELIVLFTSVKEYYEFDILVEYNFVERFKQMMYLYPSIFSDLFRFLIYAKIKARSIGDVNTFANLIKEITLENSKENFVRILLLDYYFITDKYLKMRNLLNDLECIFRKEKNIIRLFDVYECAIILLSEIEFEKCQYYIDKSKAMIDKYNIPRIKVGEMYSNIAKAYQINANYSTALDYYNKMILQNGPNYIDSYIFMADCQNHLNMEVDIPLVNTEAYDQYPTDVKLMYKYFTFGSDIPDFAKENFIIKKIAPSLVDEDYIKVFRYELLRLVNNTNHYKSIHTFEVKIKENIMKKVDEIKKNK